MASGDAPRLLGEDTAAWSCNELHGMPSKPASARGKYVKNGRWSSSLAQSEGALRMHHHEQSAMRCGRRKKLLRGMRRARFPAPSRPAQQCHEGQGGESIPGGVDGSELAALAILTMQQFPAWRVVGRKVCAAAMRVGQYPTMAAMVCALRCSITLSLSGRGAASRSLGPEARSMQRALSNGYGCARLAAAAQRAPSVAQRISRRTQGAVVASRVLDDFLGQMRRSIASALTPAAMQGTKRVRLPRPLRLASARATSFALGRVGPQSHPPAFLVVR